MPPPKKPTLLLVEDSPADLQLAELALRRTKVPHELALASDGVEALDYLLARGKWSARDPSQRPAVVLLDLKLPRLNGHQVLRAMRENELTRDVPVVVLSSSDADEDVAQSYREGAQGYYRKPIDFGEFAEGTSIFCYYWTALNVDRWSEPSPALAAEGAARAGEIVRRKGTSRVPALRPGARPRSVDALVIDAHAKDRDATADAIRPFVDAGRVNLAATGEGALEFLLSDGVCVGTDRSRCPAVVLLELDLPDLPGVELLRRIRETVGHTVTVVAFTAELSEETVAACYQFTVNSLVRKPKDPVDYKNAAAIIAHYWTRMNVAPPAHVMG